MSDLPPSYEAATGIPIEQSNVNDVVPPKPSAPPGGQITAPQYTTTIPILPQTQLSPQNQHQPPYPVQTTAYPSSAPTPQTNRTFCRRPRKSNNQCICIVVGIIFLVVIILVITLVAINKSRQKYKSSVHDTFESIYGKPEYPTFDWDAFGKHPTPEYPKFDWDTFNKNNQELLDRLNSKPFQIPKFDFN